LSVSLLSGVAILVIAQGAVRSLITAAPFQVLEAEARWVKGVSLPAQRYRIHPPTSIFQVDLFAVEQALQKQNPTAEVEAVRRILPNRLSATLSLKRIVGQIKVDRYYPVSEEGTVLLPGQDNPWPHLPLLIIEGLKGPLRVGQSLRSAGFGSAVELLDAIRRQNGLAGHRIGSIRIKGVDLILFLDSGLEIRFAGDRLSAGWQRLADLLSRKPEILEQARYIDLRFDDPVIGEKKKVK
jgi:cell division septal protein FtsQ